MIRRSVSYELRGSVHQDRPRAASPAFSRWWDDLTIGCHNQHADRDWQRSAGSRQPAGPNDRGCSSRYFFSPKLLSLTVYHHFEKAQTRPFSRVIGCPSISLRMLRKPSQQGNLSPKFVILVSHKAVKRRPNTSS